MFGQEADQLLHQVSGKLTLDVGLVTPYPSRLEGMRPRIRATALLLSLHRSSALPIRTSCDKQPATPYSDQGTTP